MMDNDMKQKLDEKISANGGVNEQMLLKSKVPGKYSTILF